MVNALAASVLILLICKLNTRLKLPNLGSLSVGQLNGSNPHVSMFYFSFNFYYVKYLILFYFSFNFYYIKYLILLLLII